MKNYFFLLTLFFGFGTISANDSIYIKFLNKTVRIEEGDRYLSFSIKKEAFLLVLGSESDSISCFIFKHNRLVSTGILVVKKNQERRMALRNGYWRFLDKNQHQEKKYFIDDDLLILHDDIPIENEM